MTLRSYSHYGVHFAVRLLMASLALSLIPQSVWACPACMTGDLKTANTYIGMTLLMSALPLVVVGGLIVWLRRRYT